MKSKVFVLILAFLFSGLHSALAKVGLPSPSAYVNDFAEILSPEFEASLNQQLADFESKTTDEISVVTVKSLGDMSVEEYAVELFGQWGIGKKNQDNGLLLLIAPSERRVKIEVGYGLEPVITDGLSGQILDTQFVPEFKKGNYEVGVLNTVNQIQSYLNDPSLVPELPATSKKSSVPVFEILFFFLFTGLPVYFLSYLSRSKEIYTGGIVGAILGFLIAGIFAGLGLAIFGFLLDYLLSRNYKNLKASGKSTNFWASRGGFRSSRSFGGGGGFGGFGGGHSGGGGSSRSW